MFHFKFRPIELCDCVSCDEPRVSWLELTDGCYWLTAGDVELFRFDDAAWRKLPPEWFKLGLPYVEYYVWQFWADMISITGKLLDPLPPLLLDLLQTYQPDEWLSRADRWLQQHNSPANEDIHDTATGWRDDRVLGTDYLKPPKVSVWFWSDNSNIHMAWDNHRQLVDGLPAWKSTKGRYTLPTSEFLKAIIDFDDSFMVAMAERVKAVCTQPEYAHLSGDCASLWTSQSESATSLKYTLDNHLNNPGDPKDWAKTMAAIQTIEAESSLF
jgi:hypothetical protein